MKSYIFQIGTSLRRCRLLASPSSFFYFFVLFSYCVCVCLELFAYVLYALYVHGTQQSLYSGYMDR